MKRGTQPNNRGPMLCRYWFAIFLCLPWLASAAPIARLTFSEGQIRLLRGTGIYALSDGIAIESDDILETPDSGFALLEFLDGTLVALGGQTHVMLASPGSAKRPMLMLLEGWVKVQTHADAANINVLTTPQTFIAWKTAHLITHARENSSALFVETGEATASTIGRNSRLDNPLTAKATQFQIREPNKAATVLPRPSDSFVTSIPRAFRDALPSRIGRFAEVKTAPRFLNEVDYEDIARWLKAPLPWRTSFVKRFGPRTRDEAFRRGLETGLKQHPEWDRVLHPERYEAKQKPSTYSVQPAR